MKQKEKDFCRLMTILADPARAAREAGYPNPDKEWPALLERDDIVDEIRRRMKKIRSVYKSTAVCGLYRLAYGDVSDALTLVYSDYVNEDKLKALDLMCVSEIKKTDKGIEIKFCDRMKAIEKLNEILGTEEVTGTASGLLDAMRKSADAIEGWSRTQVSRSEL